MGTQREAAPCPPLASLAPSPAGAGPVFGSGGAGRDLQGSGGLSDEGTPAAETGQPLGSQSPQTLCQDLPPTPCPQRTWDLGLLLLHPLLEPRAAHFFRSDTVWATSSYIWASWSQVKMT